MKKSGELLIVAIILFHFYGGPGGLEIGEKIKLKGGSDASEGRIKVKMGRRKWSHICGDGWGMDEARVVCRQLGLGSAVRATTSAQFGGMNGRKDIARVSCGGHENDLSDCSIVPVGEITCSGKASIAGVQCRRPELPDLVPDASLVENSLHMQRRPLWQIECALEEKCASASAFDIEKYSPAWYADVRKLLVFSLSSWNRGTADFRPFSDPATWDWHECHQHYHSMEEFASYDLLDASGDEVAEGHKASFCLMDTQCDGGVTPHYNCGYNQGISIGCTDQYSYRLDCQWIDVTDVDAGQYILEVRVNPDNRVPELNFKNNLVRCGVTIAATTAKASNCANGM